MELINEKDMPKPRKFVSTKELRKEIDKIMLTDKEKVLKMELPSKATRNTLRKYYRNHGCLVSEKDNFLYIKKVVND